MTEPFQGRASKVMVLIENYRGSQCFTELNLTHLPSLRPAPPRRKKMKMPEKAVFSACQFSPVYPAIRFCTLEALPFQGT